MPEMNGAMLTLKDPNTGQEISYEIVRVGTMREFRDLVKAHEERGGELKEANADRLKRAHELDDMKKELEVERHGRTTAEDALAIVASQAISADELAAVEGARDSALKSCEVLTQQRDEAKALLVEANAALEMDKAHVEVAKEHRASLIAKLDKRQSVLSGEFAEILGVLDELIKG
jgi:hypothetical protein